MNIKGIPVISIVGRSKTGKTTFIERLIPLLKKKGLKVATIKHLHHDFEFDRPGKDTYRHKQAGAKITVISSPEKIALIEDVEKELSLEQIQSRYISGVDILITEGYKKESMPKIEIYQRKEGDKPVCINDKNLIAIVTDEQIDLSVPTFLRDDVEGVAGFIVSSFIDRKVS